MTPCAVPWCGALAATDSRWCVIHRAHPDLRPTALEPDEELAPGAPCEDCTGTGHCDHCDGTGQRAYECTECGLSHQVEAECHVCDGDGRCRTCHGAGTTGAHKQPTEQGRT